MLKLIKKGGGKMRKIILLMIILIVLTSGIIAETGKILQGQTNAIYTLAERQGFTNKMLESFIFDKYEKKIHELSQAEGSDLINLFQSDNPPKPTDINSNESKNYISEISVEPKTKQSFALLQREIDNVNKQEQSQPVITDILEVGMEKRFHLIDNNIIYGKIIKVDELCHIETSDCVLKIPKGDILAETAAITRKDHTRFTGAVMYETAEKIIIRSKYGDIPIHKRDIRDMNKFHGGKKTAMKEDIHKFYKGEAELINIIGDPTAFLLQPQTFYVSGMSVGYGFTDKFMLTTKFGSSFSGDLNIYPKVRLFHHENGITEHGITVGMGIHRRHSDKRLVAGYSQAIISNQSDNSLNEIDITLDSVMLDPENRSLYNDLYVVYSNRKSLKSGRGKVGFSLGAKTNSLAWKKPDLTNGFKWNDNSEFNMPFRFWVAFEYDLRKNLKFVGSIWVDNGNKSQTLRQSFDDYFTDSTPFIFDCHEGTYSIVDFDFGFLYAVNENLRVGLHFQDPFFEFYWEFFEF